MTRTSFFSFQDTGKPVEMQLPLERLVALLLEELGNNLLHEPLRVVDLEMSAVREPRNNCFVSCFLDFLEHCVQPVGEWH